MQPQNGKKIDAQKRKLWESEQIYIRSLVMQKDIQGFDVNKVKFIAGVDVSFSGKFDNGACAGLLIYELSTKKIVWEQYEYVKLTEEYLPGFLAFRQLPPTLHLFNKLKTDRPQFWPDVIMVDGNGIVHKKQCGYACHLGVIMKIPTIGCAKTFFDVDGLHQQEVEDMLCDKLTYHSDNMVLIGKSGKEWCTAIVGDQNQNKHLYVSVGTMISLQSATKLVLKTLKYETAEPVRLVDRRSRNMIKKLSQQLFQQSKSYPMIYLRPQ